MSGTYDLSGPWEAVLTGDGGYLITLDELDDNDLIVVLVVRRTARPVDAGDGDRRLPGSYRQSDVALEFSDFDDNDEVAARWVLAQRVAQALNAEDRREADRARRRTGGAK